jgi:hypothetical protein
MDLLAREAGDRFINFLIGRDFFGGPALDVLACIRAAIKKRRHLGTTSRLKFARFELNQKARASERRTFVPKKMAPVFGASFVSSLLFCFSLVA